MRVGKDALDGVLLVSYPRADDRDESYGPGMPAKFLAAYRAKYSRDPIAPQAHERLRRASQILLECIAAAGTRPSTRR